MLSCTRFNLSGYAGVCKNLNKSANKMNKPMPVNKKAAIRQPVRLKRT